MENLKELIKKAELHKEQIERLASLHKDSCNLSLDVSANGRFHTKFSNEEKNMLRDVLVDILEARKEKAKPLSDKLNSLNELMGN